MKYLYKIFSCFLLLSESCIAEADETYDYVIAGGGTAGLTIAARLTENPNVTVAVIEAGGNHTQDVNVLAPGLLTVLYGNPKYDWNFHTVPQVHVDNQVIAHPRGKQLGGSSAINFLFWTHASQKDIDNWGYLGNHGWSWDALKPYYRKSEHYVAPTPKTERNLQTSYINPALHGKKGPIINGFPDIYGPFDKAWPRTYDTLGIQVQADPRAGIALGGYNNLLNLDTAAGSRSYAATGYYLPASRRPNLTVIQHALVNKIILAKDGDSITAKGVIYSKNGQTCEIHATREVILSAGSVGSPQILELSGIGSAEHLTKYGIDVVVENENVGENLQDHAYIPEAYEVIPGIFTLDDFKKPKVFSKAYNEYLKNHTGPLATTAGNSALLSLEQIGVDPEKFTKNHLMPSSSSRPGLDEQYKLLYQDLGAQAVTQELTIPGGISPQFANDTKRLFTTTIDGHFFTMLGVLEHPFSRGSIHIQSADPSVYPLIDPRYLSHPLDTKILSKIALHLQKVVQAEPLSSLLKGNGTVYQPGYYNLTAENVDDWIHKYLQSEYHLAGTCGMFPKSKGGVVDEKFRLYGVDNLRVVDASIFPLLPRANLQTLVYAIAERASDFIKESM